MKYLLILSIIFICGCTGLTFNYDSTGQNIASIGNAEYQGSNITDLKIGGRKFNITLLKVEVFKK